MQTTSRPTYNQENKFAIFFESHFIDTSQILKLKHLTWEFPAISVVMTNAWVQKEPACLNCRAADDFPTGNADRDEFESLRFAAFAK